MFSRNYLVYKNKKGSYKTVTTFLIRRGSGIRTHDPLLPKQVLTFYNKLIYSRLIFADLPVARYLHKYR